MSSFHKRFTAQRGYSWNWSMTRKGRETTPKNQDCEPSLLHLGTLSRAFQLVEIMSERDHMGRDLIHRMYGMVNSRVRLFMRPPISEVDHEDPLDTTWMISDGLSTATGPLESDDSSFFRLTAPGHTDASQWTLDRCLFVKVTSRGTTPERSDSQLGLAMFAAVIAAADGTMGPVTYDWDNRPRSIVPFVRSTGEMPVSIEL